MKKDLGVSAAMSIVVGCVIGAGVFFKPYAIYGAPGMGMLVWIFYTLTFACVIKLRRTKPDTQRMYKVPCYPWIPLLSIASGLYVVVSQLFLSGTRATIMSPASIGITLPGLPVYLIVKKKHK